MKYFTMSFDDGLEQDKRMIRLLKRYGLKCTFNLNSGTLGKKSRILRIGDIGFKDTEDENKFPASLFPCNDHHVIPTNEIAQVYEGFEVATHGASHKRLTGLSEEELTREITGDMEALSQLVGYQVSGHAYPFGMYNRETMDSFRKQGISYARTVKSTRSFEFPADPLLFHPTCWALSKRAEECTERFLKADPQGKDQLFCLWGHTYEFDFGSERGSWDHLESLLNKISGQKDIIYCTNIEAFQIHRKDVE